MSYDSRFLTGAAALMAAAGMTIADEGDLVYSEDFEDAVLMDSVDEEIEASEVWTDMFPGWVFDDETVQNSDGTEMGVPGAGDPENDGVTEWAGWALADGAWWTTTAGDQDRSLFVDPGQGGKAVGVIAVADPDEWDDLPHEPGTYNASLSTVIDVSAVTTDTLTVKFDSSWRPEDNQKARFEYSYDGGDPTVAFLWTSIFSCEDDTFKADAPNETLEIVIPIPAGASELTLDWIMFDAGNDWWWAFDNLEVIEGGELPPPDLGECEQFDINGDGEFNIFDFTAFQEGFVDCQSQFGGG